MSELTCGDLFAGYDGLGMGVRSVLGGRSTWFAENDPAPSKILAHHYPDVPNLGDVTRIDWANVEPVDVITGGSPCQDLSTAGKRKGMTDGTRSNLWVAMREAIDVIRPKLVVWENVRGALSAHADSDLEPCPGCVGDRDGQPVLRALGRVLGDLADIGYDSWWYGLRAADVGAPHGRFRVFLFATPADTIGSGWDGWARDTFGGPLGGTPAPWCGEDAGRELTLLPTPRTSDTNGAGVHGQGGPDLRTAVALLPTPKATNNENRSSAWANGPNLGEAIALLPTPRATDGTHGGPNQRGSSGDLMLPSAVHQNWDVYEPAIRRWEAILGRPAPSPTKTGRNGKPRLNPALVEHMMGLPHGWITDPAIGISDNDQLKAGGNGVVPQQAAAATRAWVSDVLSERAA